MVDLGQKKVDFPPFFILEYFVKNIHIKKESQFVTLFLFDNTLPVLHIIFLVHI